MRGCRDCGGFREKRCMFSRVPVGISFLRLLGYFEDFGIQVQLAQPQV